MKQQELKKLMVARQEFNSFLAVGEKSFPKLKLKTPLTFFKGKGNTIFEELGCVGYNPAFEELTATVKIKRSSGYLGDLCSNGSYEYVRFYMDYQDGNGWQDMGYTALNVHDIPTNQDCAGKDEKPIDYVVRLKIDPKKKICTVPNLPKVRAILSWNSVPAPNDPNQIIGTYVWGDVKDENIQIEPFQLQIPSLPIAAPSILLEKAFLNPTASISNLASATLADTSKLKTAKESISPKKIDFQELATLYKKEKVEPFRFGFKLLKEVSTATDNKVIANIKNLFESQKLSLSENLLAVQKLKCNTSYEELFCVGADYNQEALVGTLKIKKPSGYSGGLCSKGSKEYVSFWIQDESNCTWDHAGTTLLKHTTFSPFLAADYRILLFCPTIFLNTRKNAKNLKSLK